MSSIFGTTLLAASKKLVTGAAAVVAASTSISKGEFFPQQQLNTIRHQVNLQANAQEIDQEVGKNNFVNERSVEVQTPLEKKVQTRSWTRVPSPDRFADDCSVDSAISNLTCDSDSDPFLRHGLQMLCDSMIKSFAQNPVTELEGECAKETFLNNPAMMQKSPILKEVAALDMARQEELFDEALALLQNQQLIEDFHQRMQAKQSLLHHKQQQQQEVEEDDEQTQFLSTSTANAKHETVAEPAAAPVAQATFMSDSFSPASNTNSWTALQDRYKCIICQDVLAGPVLLSCACTSFCMACVISYETSFSTPCSTPTHFPCPHCQKIIETHLSIDARYERNLDGEIVAAVNALPVSIMQDETMQMMKADWVERRQIQQAFEAKKQAKEREDRAKLQAEKDDAAAAAAEWEYWMDYVVPVVAFCVLAFIAATRVSVSKKL